MFCEILITLRLLLYLCCFYTVECAEPKFMVPLSTTSHGSVDENSLKDISILTVEGEDTDGDTLTFSLISQTPRAPPFSLGSLSGLLTTPVGLDAEVSLIYNFTFGVSDGSKTVRSVIYTLNINDINEFSPEFQNTTNTVYLNDSVSNGFQVCNVKATDKDATALVTYTLISGNRPDTFSLNSSNGNITVRDSTQFKATLVPSYNLSIKASDGTKAAILTVSIILTVNITTDIPPDSKTETVITTLKDNPSGDSADTGLKDYEVLLIVLFVVPIVVLIAIIYLLYELFLRFRQGYEKAALRFI